MKEGTKIRAATVDDIAFLRKFFGAVYHPNHICTEERHLLWHFHNPFRRGSPEQLSSIIAVDSNGTISGFLGSVPTELYVRGKKIFSAWLANWIIKEEMRGKGVGTGILKEMGRNKLLLASSMSRMAYPLYLKRGFTVLGKYSRLIYINNPERTLSLIRSMHPKEVVSKLDAKIFTTREFFSRNNENIKIEWDKKFNEKEWNEAWIVIRKRFEATTDRTSKYIRWRFREHPYIKYHIGIARTHEGSILGMAVVRIETARVPVDFSIARIVDIVSIEQADRALIDSVIQFAKEHRCGTIDMYITFKEYERVGREKGFRLGFRMPFLLIPELFNPVAFRLSDPYQRTIIFKDNRMLKSSLPVLDRWHIVKADGDRDRAY